MEVDLGECEVLFFLLCFFLDDDVAFDAWRRSISLLSSLFSCASEYLWIPCFFTMIVGQLTMGCDKGSDDLGLSMLIQVWPDHDLLQ